MSETTYIKALPKDISDKIAAGEVVERPLSVVKELVENSLDAGASSVTVEMRKGGKEYIRVTDDGRGIDPEETTLAFMRYATSKIYTDEDLGAIRTLGFRGEALASIASVSETEMITRTAENRVGTRIVYVGGNMIEKGDCACESGTTVVVRDLFCNTPARRKFMRSDSAEASMVIDYVSKMSIAYPHVRFRLINNGSILFSTAGKGDIQSCVATVYDPVMARFLIPVDFSDRGMRLSGLVSPPDKSRTSRRQQIFFVNGRWVRNRVIEMALEDAYRDKLFEGRFPSAFLFLELAPDALDVNIHPNKTDIRFFDETAVREFICKAIRRALLSKDALAEIKIAPPKGEESPEEEPAATVRDVQVPEGPKTETAQTSIWKAAEGPAAVYVASPEAESAPFKQLFTELRREEAQKPVQEEFPVKPAGRLRFSELETVGQVFAAYIIAKDEENVYFIDQHAAHERILYEKLTASFHGEAESAQLLMVPSLVQLPAAQKEETADRIEILNGIGFKIEDFGPGDLAIREIPASMSLEEAETFVHTVLEAETTGDPDAERKRDRLITMACKSAIKANRRLDTPEIRALLEALDDCENPLSCPHGRPTFIKLSEGYLEHLFKRK